MAEAAAEAGIEPAILRSPAATHRPRACGQQHVRPAARAASACVHPCRRGCNACHGSVEAVSNAVGMLKHLFELNASITGGSVERLRTAASALHRYICVTLCRIASSLHVQPCMRLGLGSLSRPASRVTVSRGPGNPSHNPSHRLLRLEARCRPLCHSPSRAPERPKAGFKLQAIRVILGRDRVYSA
jgi:hypothetical protein